MRLEQLQYFLEIAECHSINKASRNLFISQPALSQAIRDFEKELGITLFKRSKQGTFLTTEGEIIYKDAKTIVSQLLSCYQNWLSLSAEKLNLKGTVDVLAAPLICNIFLEEILPDMQKKYPQINIALHESIAPSELIPAVADRFYNIGANIFYDGNKAEIFALGKKYKLNIDILFESRYLLYISKNHPLAKKSRITSEDLKQYTLVIYSDPKEIVCENFSRYFNQDMLYRMNNIENILRMVRHNQCVTVLAEDNHRHFPMQDIITKPICDVQFPVYYYIAYPSFEKLSALEKIVIKYTKDYFQEKNGK